MMLGVCVGTAFGIGLLTGGTTTLVTALLGAVLAVYGAISLVSARFVVSPRSEKWLSPLIGLVTGALTGATGVFVIPAVPYLNSLGLDKDDLIQALGISFTVSTVALAIGLAANARIDASVVGHSLLALIPAVVGMLLGQRARNRLHPPVFRRWFLAGMLLLGFYMFARALTD
jgi:hypothetical protein